MDWPAAVGRSVVRSRTATGLTSGWYRSVLARPLSVLGLGRSNSGAALVSNASGRARGRSGFLVSWSIGLKVSRSRGLVISRSLGPMVLWYQDVASLGAVQRLGERLTSGVLSLSFTLDDVCILWVLRLVYSLQRSGAPAVPHWSVVSPSVLCRMSWGFSVNGHAWVLLSGAGYLTIGCFLSHLGRFRGLLVFSGDVRYTVSAGHFFPLPASAGWRIILVSLGVLKVTVVRHEAFQPSFNSIKCCFY